MATTLYRPVGQPELDLIAASEWHHFPPRLNWQPIFYPVLNEEYATRIAREWNTKDAENGNVGYVLSFYIDTQYLDRFETQQVGDEQCLEYWVPAERLDEFNSNISGQITVVSEWRSETDVDTIPPEVLEVTILSVLTDVEPLMVAAFDEVDGTPAPGSNLDQAFLLDGRTVIEDYLNHNELGVALEHLMYMIEAPPLQIQPSTLRKIRSLHSTFDLSAENWARFAAHVNYPKPDGPSRPSSTLHQSKPLNNVRCDMPDYPLVIRQ